MTEYNREKKDYIGYDYKEMIVDDSRVSEYLDGYECFGWEIDEHYLEMHSQPEGSTYVVSQEHAKHTIAGKTAIKLQRNRKIMNKTELTRLQRHFEDTMKQIAEMEVSKERLATMIAIIIGVVGTAFMAGSVFAISHEPPMIVLCILLAIPAFIGWVLPYFVYKWIKNEKAQQINPLIEKKWDEIHEICEKGHTLL